ncbi:15680_t:CDS:2 [Dentiscutata heterogama]|uniref:15680_t:CDS:1 n=1 Tax=Dentiscutata heterogama TaxID=1316150 RepID=A0ACA9M194_9GLOM|nr:15680_t:CDS:2 [Dentiscutata heterogama]
MPHPSKKKKNYPDDNFECEFLDFGPDVDKSNRPSNDFDCEFYVNKDESYTTSENHRNALLKLIEINLGFDPPPTIHVNTAYNYLKALGYEFSQTKKRIYVDGHERDDVNIEIEMWLELSPGKKLYILVIYDKCVFSLYNDICRHLKLDASSPNYPKKACVIITPEWFPGAVAVFAFDNATSYATFAPDTLVAK